MKDKMYYLTVGFILSSIISMVIIWANPMPEAAWCNKMEEVCTNCGMKAWYFQYAEDIANDN